MKKILVASLLVSAASIASANDDIYGGNPDLYGSHLLDHEVSQVKGQTQSGRLASGALDSRNPSADNYYDFIDNPDFLKTDRNAKVEEIEPGKEWCMRGDMYQRVDTEQAC